MNKQFLCLTAGFALFTISAGSFASPDQPQAAAHRIVKHTPGAKGTLRGATFAHAGDSSSGSGQSRRAAPAPPATPTVSPDREALEMNHFSAAGEGEFTPSGRLNPPR